MNVVRKFGKVEFKTWKNGSRFVQKYRIEIGDIIGDLKCKTPYCNSLSKVQKTLICRYVFKASLEDITISNHRLRWAVDGMRFTAPLLKKFWAQEDCRVPEISKTARKWSWIERLWSSSLPKNQNGKLSSFGKFQTWKKGRESKGCGHHLFSSERVRKNRHHVTRCFHTHTHTKKKKQQWWPIDQRQGRGGPWAWASCLQGTQEGLKKTPWLSLHAVFWRLYSISFLLEPVSVVSHVPGVWRNQKSFWTLWTWMPKKLLSSKKLMKKI